jgi:hypothetical protein
MREELLFRNEPQTRNVGARRHALAVTNEY